MDKLSLEVLNPEASFLNASVGGHAALERGCELSLGSRFLHVSGRAHRLSPTRSRISPFHFTLWNPEGVAQMPGLAL